MMDKRGFELTISTIVIIITAVAVLIGLFIFLNKGFDIFEKGTVPFIESVEVASIKESCNFACQTQDFFTFCCRDFSFDDESTSCLDRRLDLSCSEINCESFDCSLE